MTRLSRQVLVEGKLYYSHPAYACLLKVLELQRGSGLV